MNEDNLKEVINDIIALWNDRDYKKKIHARNKLKLTKWFMPIKTYNYLANIMGESLLPELDINQTKTEMIEEQDILKLAQKVIGGKIIKE